jgi:cytochrome c biogenesis protein CcdA
MLFFDIPIGFAFSAGIVAAFNPCGVVMLPAYIGYQLGAVTETDNPLKAVSQGIGLGLMATAGFVTFSLVVGFVVTITGGYIVSIFPIAGLAVGIIIMTTGAWLTITNRHITLTFVSRIGLNNKRGYRGVFIFGILYAISSLGCAFPIFLAAVGILSGNQLGNMNFLESMARFVSYGLGMGLVLTTATLGVVLFRDIVSQFIRKIIPLVGFLGNIFLLLSGLYLVYYWTLGDGSSLLM